jgi:hypothetical protein
MIEKLTMEKSDLLSSMSPFNTNESLANIQSSFYDSFGKSSCEGCRSIITDRATPPEKGYNLIIEKDNGINSKNAQFVTYLDVPGKKMDSITIYDRNDEIPLPLNTKKKGEPELHWDRITHFYFISLTVVGLYVFFKVLQKSK